MSTAKKMLMLLGALVVIICLKLAHLAFEDYWHRQAIPSNIELLSSFEIVSESAFAKDCSTAIYRLSESTYNLIQQQGLAFLNADLNSRDEPNIQYAPWQETPRLDWEPQQDWSTELQCGGKLARMYYRSIIESAKQTGSYFTLSGTIVLLVLPEKRMVVISQK